MTIRKSAGLSAVASAALLLSAAAPHAAAQSKSVIRSGSIEIGPFLGASYGIDQTRFMGGGNVTFALNKYILPYAEYSYFPGIGRSTSGVFPGTGRPYSTTYSLPLSDFHGGVHIRFPIHEKPIVPYLVFGFGGLTHLNRTVNATYTSPSDSGGVIVSQVPVNVPGGTDPAINTGGGIRFYLGQRFGVRVEAKAYRPFGDFPDVFGKAEVGFFFQLR